MDSSEEEDLIALAALALQRKRRKKRRRVWEQPIFQERRRFGIQHLVDEMRLSSRESYFLSEFLFTLVFCVLHVFMDITTLRFCLEIKYKECSKK